VSGAGDAFGPVRRLSEADRREAIEVLSLAFQDYPVMRFVVRAEGEAYEEGLRDLVKLFAGPRFPRGHPVLGIETAAGVLVGVACLDPPRPRPKTAESAAIVARQLRRLGAASRARLKAFGEAEDEMLPVQPHYYLGMLGVHPEHRGEGLARLLLEAVHDLSAADQDSRGVALTTELPDNLALYEHFGYRRTATVELAGMTTWGFFRPDSRGDSE
jgi:GNAT superfamily N-acetyltransferase